MPLPALVFGSVIAAIAVNLVVKVLLALGIGFVSYSGITNILDYAQTEIQNRAAALPPEVLQMFSIMNIDVYITTVMSALAIKLSLKGVTTAGVLTAISYSLPETE